MANEYAPGTASDEAITAEASPETQKALKEETKVSTAVAPLTTADVAPKKTTAKKLTARKSAAKKKGR